MRRRSHKQSAAILCVTCIVVSCSRPAPNRASNVELETEGQRSSTTAQTAQAPILTPSQLQAGSTVPTTALEASDPRGATPHNVENFSEFWKWLPRVQEDAEAHIVVDTLPRTCVRVRFEEPNYRRASLSLATTVGEKQIWYENDGDHVFRMYGAPRSLETGAAVTACRQSSAVKKTHSGWTLDGATVFQSSQQCIVHVDSATPLSLLDRDNDLTYLHPGDEMLCWRALFDATGGGDLVETVDPATDTTFFEFWKELPNKGLHKVMFAAAELAPRRCVELTLQRPKRRIFSSTLRMLTRDGSSTAEYRVVNTDTVRISFSTSRPGIGYSRKAKVERTDRGWTFEGATVFHTEKACQANLKTATALPQRVNYHAGVNMWEVMFAHANGQHVAP